MSSDDCISNFRVIRGHVILDQYIFGTYFNNRIKEFERIDEVTTEAFSLNSTVSFANDCYGELQSNETWTGYIGRIQRGEVDIVMPVYTELDSWEYNPRILETVDICQPVEFRSQVMFLYEAPPQHETSFRALLRPFAPEVWCGVVVSLILMAMCIVAICRKQSLLWSLWGAIFRQPLELKWISHTPNHSGKSQEFFTRGQTEDERPGPSVMNIKIANSCKLQESGEVRHKKVSFRTKKKILKNLPKLMTIGCFLVALWLLFVNVMTLAFTSTLLSALTVPRKPWQPRNFQQLADGIRKGAFPTYINHNDAFLISSAYNSIEHLSYISKEIMKNNWYMHELRDALNRYGVGEEDFHKIFKSIATIIEVFDDARFNTFPTYFYSEDTLHTKWRSYFVKKGFCGFERLNDIVLRLYAAGIGTQFRNLARFRYEHLPFHLRRKPKALESLTFSNLSGAFYLLSIGLVISIIAFLGEVFIFKIRFLWRKM